MGNSCSPGCAGDAINGVFLCCPFSPRDVLDEIWDLIEPCYEGFRTYYFNISTVDFPFLVGIFLQHMHTAFMSLN